MLKRMKIWQKLTLMVVLMVVPIGTLAYLFVKSQNQRVDATRSELSGLEYLKPVRTLLEHASQHRAALHIVLNGNESRSAELEPLRAKIDADLQAVESAEQNYGAGLQTGASLTAVRTQWDTLKKQIPSLSVDDNLEAHNKFIEAILDHVQLVGDRSQLMTDSQLDTAYLARAMVSGLLRNAESVGQLFAHATGSVW
jgi:hypothetical protein